MILSQLILIGIIEGRTNKKVKAAIDSMALHLCVVVTENPLHFNFSISWKITNSILQFSDDIQE